MSKVKISGDTPLECKMLVEGDYYKVTIPNGDECIAVYRSGTILTIKFTVIFRNKEFVFESLEIPTYSLIDNDQNFNVTVEKLDHDSTAGYINDKMDSPIIVRSGTLEEMDK